MFQRSINRLLLVSAMLASPTIVAQDSDAVAEGSERTARQERIAELRQLMREERQAQRQDIEERLANLSDDERAALQERRQMRQAQQRRENRTRRGQRQLCDCSDTTTEIQPDAESVNSN